MCTGVRRRGISDIDLDDEPIVEIDPGGEVITGYLFGDNYFELSVNGRLIGVDPVPYTPFNAVVVRFRVNRPVTYAVKLVDWEDAPGLGTERLGANPFHAGDGGFIASFSHGTVTDASWQARNSSGHPTSCSTTSCSPASLRSKPSTSPFHHAHVGHQAGLDSSMRLPSGSRT